MSSVDEFVLNFVNLALVIYHERLIVSAVCLRLLGSEVLACHFGEEYTVEVDHGR